MTFPAVPLGADSRANRWTPPLCEDGRSKLSHAPPSSARSGNGGGNWRGSRRCSLGDGICGASDKVGGEKSHERIV